MKAWRQIREAKLKDALKGDDISATSTAAPEAEKGANSMASGAKHDAGPSEVLPASAATDPMALEASAFKPDAGECQRLQKPIPWLLGLQWLTS